MAAGPVRDDAALVGGFDRWLAARGDQRVQQVRRPSSGWTNETVLLEIAGPGAPAETLVVRMPPLVPSFPEHELELEAAVLRALARSPVPVPAVVALEHDESWIGAPFLVMSFVAGHVLGDVPAFDGWLGGRAPDERHRLHEAFVCMLAALHTFGREDDDWKVSAVGATLRAGVADELAYWRDYLAWAADGSPTRRLADALDWCAEAAARDRGVESLLWGDPRLGNVIVGDDGGIAALIDWEGATLGPPEMDLGWYLALDGLTTHFVGRTVPGFLDRAGVIDCYERALGRAVEQLEWHEVFALVRSAAINECQARLAARVGTPYPGVAGDDNPVLDYLWSRIAAI